MRIAFAFAAILGMQGLAEAVCFEDIGCTDSETYSKRDLRRLSCDNLWLTRNTIYDENGYCFKTADGKAQFDNSDCRFRDAARVPLNNYERRNITSIKQVEAEKGCN